MTESTVEKSHLRNNQIDLKCDRTRNISRADILVGGRGAEMRTKYKKWKLDQKNQSNENKETWIRKWAVEDIEIGDNDGEDNRRHRQRGSSYALSILLQLTQYSWLSASVVTVCLDCVEIPDLTGYIVLLYRIWPVEDFHRSSESISVQQNMNIIEMMLMGDRGGEIRESIVDVRRCNRDLVSRFHRAISENTIRSDPLPLFWKPSFIAYD
jgi:hypothetical protein